MTCLGLLGGLWGRSLSSSGRLADDNHHITVLQFFFPIDFWLGLACIHRDTFDHVFRPSR